MDKNIMQNLINSAFAVNHQKIKTGCKNIIIEKESKIFKYIFRKYLKNIINMFLKLKTTIPCIKNTISLKVTTFGSHSFQIKQINILIQIFLNIFELIKIFKLYTNDVCHIIIYIIMKIFQIK